MINIKELKKYCNPSYLTIRNDKIIINNKRLARLSKTKIKKIEEEFGIPVIYSRSYENISQKMGRHISKYKIINPKDKIIVGLSGGKDSLALLHLLEPYRRRYGIEIYAITIDLNINGIRPWSSDNKNMASIKKHCENLNIPHKIIGFDKDVVEMSKILSENTKGIEYSPCFSCSVVRRYILTNFAMKLLEVNTNNIDINKIKICLGHTLEDNSDTILANILKGDVIKTLEPLKNFEEAVFDFKEFKLKLQKSTIIRPLLSVSEKEIIKALNECSISYYRDKDECPYSRDKGDSIRKKSHEILDYLEKDVKNVREMVVSSILKSMEFYGKK
ncbi:tRNA lysidine(34) synthetase [Methanothermococcus okinawensis]|uniref:PP-loop domain protein n=1 Tax=Methanothermococcus okinawensis (strain DSM 14208 / JCM 11175 / IH1) TaxID=647113 RepID=F8AL43_METOI|nr:tRNA 2-thiocytidine biosynthesis TtcA family protein [Methanothermococcus okinawensis]AEH06481.1 PP-loop domain protein [Methanothermococcus okinawensis IH1]